MVTCIYVAPLCSYEPPDLLLPINNLAVAFHLLSSSIQCCQCLRSLLTLTEDFCDPDPFITVSAPPLRSNCPCSLAAALARATADSILQTDLSIHHLNKTVEDGADPIPRESSGILEHSPSQIRSFFADTHHPTHKRMQTYNHQGFDLVLPDKTALNHIWPIGGSRRTRKSQ